MAVAVLDAPRAVPARVDAHQLGALVLVRLSVSEAGVGEAELARDLQPLVSPVVDAGEWRLLLGRLVAAHIRDQFAVRRSSRLHATASGRRRAEHFLGASLGGAEDWPAVRDGALVARALGMPGLPARRLRALRKIEGLRSAIVVAAHGLKPRSVASASRLRNDLALLALDRAFGNRLQRELGSKSGLSAKAARLLAGQLSARPRDFGSDSRLVAGLAAEAVGAPSSTLPALRLALLRRFIAGDLAWPMATPSAQEAPAKPATAPPPTTTAVAQRLRPAPAAGHVPSGRPDPEAFARTIKELARPLAVGGWSGSRKVFISQVWSAVRDRHPGWGLSEIEFKAMLTEAHRTGLLVLGTSDLRDKRDLDDIQASATVFKNTVWHFVRVDD
ncbi:MAG: hypothetical protein ACK4TL_13020 [Hyphomicrobiaceae bacterium]